MKSSLSSVTPLRIVNADLLRRFAPLAKLSAAQLDHIAGSSRIEFARRNETLFSGNHSAERTVYLLEGAVTLFAGGKAVESFQAGSERATHAILNSAQKDCVAHADANLTILSLDNRALTETALDGQPNPDTNLNDQAQWLKLFLRSNAFLKLPAGNLQTLVARMEEVPVRAGQVIIHQGGSANNYYIVKSGSCRVLRQIPGSESPLELAVLNAGDGFGEDALITRGRRNASVIMLEDGALMRLSRHNFTNILVNPVLSTVSMPLALQKAAAGAVLLDVRAPNEYRKDGLANAINIPLPLLRANLENLDKTSPHIAYCNTGNLSAAAAFMLAQRGMLGFVIAGGVRATAPALKAPAPKKTARATAKPKPAASPKTAKAPVTAAKTAPTPQTTSADTALFRDEMQLWTSIPTTENVDPSALRVVDAAPTIHSVGRNKSIRCVENTQDVAAVAKEMAEASTPDGKSDRTVKVGWVSDHYMWETTLGLRRDPSVDPALGVSSSLELGASTANLTIQARHDDPGVVPTDATNARSDGNGAPSAAAGLARFQAKRRLKRWLARSALALAVSLIGAMPWIAPAQWNMVRGWIDLAPSTISADDTTAASTADASRSVATPPPRQTKPAPTAAPRAAQPTPSEATPTHATSPEREMMSIF